MDRTTIQGLTRAESSAEGQGVGPVVFESRGALLLMGDYRRARAIAEALSPPLKVLAVVDAVPHDARPSAGTTLVPGTVCELRGHLGRFAAAVEGPQGAASLAPLCPNRDGLFDLVIDLYDPPLLPVPVPPFGYFPVAGEGDRLRRCLTEAPALVGRFSKPRYFHYQPGLCVHARKGITGCTRCLEVCPAGAIRSHGERIQVDAHLCQGCGSCTQVCPTGAVSYARPPRGEALEAILAALRQVHEETGAAPGVVLHEPAISQGSAGERDGGGRVWIPLDRLACLGMETWLAILSRGAADMILMAGRDMAQSVWEVLEREVALTRRILAGLGLDPGRLRLERAEDVGSNGSAESMSPWGREGPPGVGHPGEDRRAVLWRVIGELSGTRSGPVPAIELPEGAPFGEVRVDARECTLCGACTRLCPSGALALDAEQRLTFREGTCVQCALCARGCPEGAIELAPRLVLDVSQRTRRRILKEGEMALCGQCGEPFMPRAMLEACRARVKDHPMFAGQGDGILGLCPTCRMAATGKGALGGMIGAPCGEAQVLKNEKGKGYVAKS